MSQHAFYRWVQELPQSAARIDENVAPAFLEYIQQELVMPTWDAAKVYNKITNLEQVRNVSIAAPVILVS